jgi:hypothetical protein
MYGRCFLRFTGRYPEIRVRTFIMTDGALSYLNKSGGWEPSLITSVLRAGLPHSQPADQADHLHVCRRVAVSKLQE